MSYNAFNYEQSILSIAKHKRGALDELYQQESGKMMSLAYARLQQDRSLANKAVELTFKTIYTQADRYTPDLGSAIGWIYSLLDFRIQKIYQENESEILSRAEVKIHQPEKIDLNDDSMEENARHFFELFYQLSEKEQLTLFNMYITPKQQVDLATDFNTAIAYLRQDLHQGLGKLSAQLEHIKNKPQQIKISEYVLGGLNHNQSKEALELINEEPHLLETLLTWQAYFQYFILLLPQYKPNSFVIDQIKDYVKESKQSETQESPASETQSSTGYSTTFMQKIKQYWYYIVMVLLACLCLGLLMTESYRTNQVKMIAYLDDIQDQRPLWLVKLSHQTLTLETIQDAILPDDSEFVVWLEPADTKSAYIPIKRLSSTDKIYIDVEDLPTEFKAWDKIAVFLTAASADDRFPMRPEGTPLCQGYLLPLNP